MNFLTTINKKYFNTYFLLFAILFLYLIIRAAVIEPYYDEVYSLFHFVESFEFFPSELNDMSSNHHLLNTWLGKLIYLFFGDNFFALRIPNLLAFCLYFFSIKRISELVIKKELQIFTVFALVTISWVVEYFAYFRGYGLSLGFFFMSLLFFLNWIKTTKVLDFYIFLSFLYLSYLSNLSFFNTLVIMLCYSMIYLFINRHVIEPKLRVNYFLSLVVFVLLLVPLAYYTFKLKSAGALWWGNQDGLWETTGASLFSLTFGFYKEWGKYIFVIFIIGYFYFVLFSIRKMTFRKFISKFEGLVSILFFGNLLIILLLSSVLNVNYPLDRAAIILVPLTILAFISIIQMNKDLMNFKYFLFFFPISFIINSSFHYSIYQNDHRIKRDAFNVAYNQLDELDSYAVNDLLYNSAMFNLRKYEIPKLFTRQNESDENVRPTFLITRMSAPMSEDYKMIYSNKFNEISIYKDFRHYEYTQLLDTAFKHSNSINDEFISLLNSHKLIRDDFPFVMISINGTVVIENNPIPLNLVMTILDINKELTYYNGIEIKNLLQKNNYLSFAWNSPIIKNIDDSVMIQLYYWNLEKQIVLLNDFSVSIYGVNEN